LTIRIQDQDIARVIVEIREQDIDPIEWLEREGIEPSTIPEIAQAMLDFHNEEETDDPELDMFRRLCDMFRYGWECGKQLGKRYDYNRTDTNS